MKMATTKAKLDGTKVETNPLNLTNIVGLSSNFDTNLTCTVCLEFAQYILDCMLQQQKHVKTSIRNPDDLDNLKHKHT